MQFQVDFGASQSGVGYQFYDASGVIGSRITSGVTNPRTGVYTATATAGGGAIGIYWDCADADFTAQEDLAERLIVEPNVDVAISSRMATYTQPTGFLAATFPSGTVANTTNITAGVITTVTNLTNAPTAGDFTADMKTSLNAATPAVTVSDKTGFALTSAYDPAKTAAQAGDAMALTSGERTSVGTAVWASATRTLSSFGSLVSDIWAAVVDSSGITTLLTRIASVLTITSGKVDVNDKTDFALTAAYDAAKTAMQDGGNAVATNMRGTDNALLASNIDLTSGRVNIGKINDTTITGDGQPGTEFGV